jgi:undecaprenyl-diphosphatase
MKRIVITALVLAFATSAHAGGGPLGIDHQLAFDQSGIWKRSYQTGLMALLVGGEVAGALAEGGESRLGKTLWQSIDATVFALGGATAGKLAFQRSRPNQGNGPDQWFQGSHNYSFPSAEVATVSAVVTPMIMQYGGDHPEVYALALLPAYVGAARLKSQAHWQTDVLAGAAVGIGSGYYAAHRDSPLVLSAMPQSVYVGFRKQW